MRTTWKPSARPGRVRRVGLIAVLLGAAAFAGCRTDWFHRAPKPSPPPPSAAAPRTAASAPAGEEEVMAYVNGEAIPMSRLYDLLLRNYGAETAWQLVSTELVLQEAARQNVAVTGADLEAEEKRSLEQVFGFVPEESQRRKLLETELVRRRISEKQWRMVLQRNAALYQLAERQARVSDAEMQTAFADLYGLRVVVRHIQAESLAKAQELLQQLHAGADFAELARKHSTNATGQDGGRLPPITASSQTVPPALRQAALEMKQPGQVAGPVLVGTAYHLLCLQERIEPQNVRLEDVRDKVAAEARKRKINLIRDEIMRGLLRSARIEYVDPVLKTQAREEPPP